ncbi:MAG TPA: zf-HC2 domain-containing protein, partial [Polyangia bacterium]
MIERARDCRSELVALARRGRLSHAENLALQAHLAGCAPCRLSRQVLSDFGELNTVDHHDDVRIERLSAVARGWTQGRARPRRRWRATRRIRFLAFAGGIALLAGTASAAIWLRHKPPQVTATLEAPRPTVDRTPAKRTVADLGSPRTAAALQEFPLPPATEPPRRREIRAAT